MQLQFVCQLLSQAHAVDTRRILELIGQVNGYDFQRDNRIDQWYFVGTICPNATWNQNGTLFISNYLGDNYWASFGDFVIDSTNNFFINEPGNYRVLKISPKNTSSYTVAAITNVSENYQATNIFLDKNGALYTAESMVRKKISFISNKNLFVCY